MSLEQVKTIAELFTAAFVPLSIYLAYLQIRKTLEWNKKKTAEEALAQVVTGEAASWYESIHKKIGWSLLTDHRKYDEVVKKLSPDQKSELNDLLLKILRQLETITIKIDHDVYDESICFDYMFSIVINTYLSCEPYIKQHRNDRMEPRLFEHVEKFAKKWQEDVNKKRSH